MNDWDKIGPLNQKVHAFRAQFVEYQLLTDIKEDLRMLVERDNAASEGGVMTLIGVPGSGKTQLIQDFIQSYPRQPHAIRHPDGRVADRVTVIVVSVPDTGVKTLSEAIYEQLAGRSPPAERRFDIQKAIYHYAEEMELKLVIFEESHETAADASNKTVEAVARLFKQFSNKARFSILIVGTEEAYRLIQANRELRRRGLGKHELKPLSWDDPDGRKLFIGLLKSWDKFLQNVFAPSGLGETALASKIYRSSDGVIGLAAVLIERAAVNAVKDKVRGRTRLAGKKKKSKDKEEKPIMSIDEVHLHDAHRQLDRGEPNPFKSELELAEPEATGEEEPEGVVEAELMADAEPRRGRPSGRRAARDKNFRP